MSFNSRSVEDTFNRMVRTVVGTVTNVGEDVYDLKTGKFSCYATVCRVISEGNHPIPPSAQISLIGSSKGRDKVIHAVISNGPNLLVDTFGRNNKIDGDDYVCASKATITPQRLPVIGSLPVGSFYSLCEKVVQQSQQTSLQR